MFSAGRPKGEYRPSHVALLCDSPYQKQSLFTERAADLTFYCSGSQTFNDPVLEHHDQDDERDCDHH
jgi:hypothetical protein